MAEAPMPLTYKFMNKSVATRSSENANAASLNDLLKLEERFKDNAQWYSQRITNYLLEYSTQYPLYLNPGNGIDTIIPKKTDKATKLYLSISADGFANLNVASNYRDPINFYGVIEKR